jgi:hypothetical protein
MNSLTTGSNVYYLPAPAPIRNAPAAPPSLFRRLTKAWWRLRLVTAEIWVILRGPRAAVRPDDYGLLPDQEIVVTRLPARPAQVIDFEAAKLRLRP